MLAAHFASALTNLLLAGVPVGIWAAVLRFRHDLSHAEIFQRLGLQAPKGAVIATSMATTIAVAFVLYRYLTVPLETLANEGSPLRPFKDAEPGVEAIVCTFLYGMLQTGFCEELLFRGLIAGALGRRMPLWKANLLQAIPFTLMHLPVLLFVPSEWVLIVIVPTIMGLALGWIRLKSDSILGPWLVHGLSNWAIALLVLYKP